MRILPILQVRQSNSKGRNFNVLLELQCDENRKLKLIFEEVKWGLGRILRFVRVHRLVETLPVIRKKLLTDTYKFDCNTLLDGSLSDTT